jgi:hypothetical protein
MSRNQKGFGIFETLFVFGVIGAIIGVAYYYLNYNTRVKITNNGTTFSFDMGTPGEVKKLSTTNNDLNYYAVKVSEYDYKVVAAAYSPDQPQKSEISCLNTTFKVDILGSSHSVCNLKNILYVANFNSGDTWYQVTAFAEDAKSEVTKETIMKLFSSLQIEQSQ